MIVPPVDFATLLSSRIEFAPDNDNQQPFLSTADETGAEATRIFYSGRWGK